MWTRASVSQLTLTLRVLLSTWSLQAPLEAEITMGSDGQVGIMTLVGSIAKRGTSLIEKDMSRAGGLKFLLRQTEKYALNHGSLLIEGDSWV